MTGKTYGEELARQMVILKRKMDGTMAASWDEAVHVHFVITKMVGDYAGKEIEAIQFDIAKATGLSRESIRDRYETVARLHRVGLSIVIEEHASWYSVARVIMMATSIPEATKVNLMRQIHIADTTTPVKTSIEAAKFMVREYVSRPFRHGPRGSTPATAAADFVSNAHLVSTLQGVLGRMSELEPKVREDRWVRETKAFIKRLEKLDG